MNVTAVPVSVHPGGIVYDGEGHFAWSLGHASEASKDVQQDHKEEKIDCKGND